MMISIDVEKASDKIQHLFVLNKLGIKENFLNMVKVFMKNPQLTPYLMVEDWKNFP